MTETRLQDETADREGRFSFATRVAVGFSGLFRFLLDLAKELADESAYSRHLSWHQRDHSAAEWKAFCDARLARKYQQGKCC